MAFRSPFDHVRLGGADQIDTSLSYAVGSGNQSKFRNDDSDFFNLGDDWDKPPRMSSALVQFLHEKAGVPVEFIDDFERITLVWNLKLFMKWFSTGSTFDIVKRFGLDFCRKYPIQIARIDALHYFLRKYPLAISRMDLNTPIYQSFDREEWWSFLQLNRWSIQIYWDDAINQLFDEMIERTTNRPSVIQPELQVPIPRMSVTNHPESPNTYQTGGFGTREIISNGNQSSLVLESKTKTVVTSPAISSIPTYTPACVLDQIQRRDIGKGSDQCDEFSKTKRNIISINIKPWNGDWECFPMLKSQIVTATLKAGMSHCTDDEVIQQYIATGGDTAIILNFPEYCMTISPSQFQDHIRSFYDTLMEISMCCGKDIIMKWQESQDGILAYHDLVTRFELEGNKTIVLKKLQKYEQIQQENHTRKSVKMKLHGDLINIADRVESSLEELEEHNMEVNNLVSYFNKVGKEFNCSMFITPEIIRLMVPDSKKDFLQARKELIHAKLRNMEKEDLQGAQFHDESHRKLPAQDGQVDYIQLYSDDDLEATGISKGIAHIDPFDNKDLEVPTWTVNAIPLPKRNAPMIQSTVSSDETFIRVYIKSYGFITHDQPSSVGNTIVISDSGTDTTILDNSWSITIVSKGLRLKNLMRCNPTLGTRYGLPVVDMVAKAIVQSGGHILIGIREGAYNCTTKYILFPKFQNQNLGILINSVSKNHRLMHDGLYGTQSMYYDADDPNDWIKYDLLNGVKTFHVSRRTKDEICSILMSWLTPTKKWRSNYLKGENSIISSFSSKNQEFRIDNPANSNEISDYEKGGICVPITTWEPPNKSIRNRKHRQNKRFRNSNNGSSRKRLCTKGSEEIFCLKYYYYVDQDNTLRVTDGRTICRLHSNVGPVYGASGSVVDRTLLTYPENFNQIGGPPINQNLELVGSIDGSPDTGLTCSKVQIGDQKSTFGSRADVSSPTYPQSLDSIGRSNLWSPRWIFRPRPDTSKKVYCRQWSKFSKLWICSRCSIPYKPSKFEADQRKCFFSSTWRFSKTT